LPLALLVGLIHPGSALKRSSVNFAQTAF